MAKPRNKYVDYLVYIAARLLAMFVNMFSPRANARTARLMGDLLYLFDARHRNIAIRHLALSFPDWPEWKVRRVARQSMQSLARLALEFMQTARMVNPTSWRRHTVLINQAESLRLLTERARGIVYIAGHFGNWERMGYTMAILGFDGFAVARPLDNPYINRYVKAVRQRCGLTIIDKKGAARLMDGILTSRRYVSFIADQDAGWRGMFVDFFGRPASTNKAPALVAMRYEVPVIVSYCRRLDDDGGFEIGIERIIQPADWAGQDDPAMWITQQYTNALEDIARRAPEQYLWAHRRWKHSPPARPPARRPSGPAGPARRRNRKSRNKSS